MFVFSTYNLTRYEGVWGFVLIFLSRGDWWPLFIFPTGGSPPPSSYQLIDSFPPFAGVESSRDLRRWRPIPPLVDEVVVMKECVACMRWSEKRGGQREWLAKDAPSSRSVMLLSALQGQSQGKVFSDSPPTTAKLDRNPTSTAQVTFHPLCTHPYI